MSIIEVIGGICKEMSKCMGIEVNYLFGDTAYVNTILSVMSRSDKTSPYKFPLVILHTPFSERRDDPNIFTSSKIAVTIAVKTSSGYTNEVRLQKSFNDQLRPLYESFLNEFGKNDCIEISYNRVIPHTYRDRYDLGSRGAMDSNNKKLNDLIDAIEIEDLEIKLKNKKCYGNRL